MKIKLNQENNVASNKARLNTKEALLKVLTETRVNLLLSDSTFLILLSAKGTGKSYLANVGEAYIMEKDPMASCVGLRKYSTAAAKRLSDSFSNTLVKMKRAGFTFPKGYKKSQQLMYRLTSKSNMLENQSIEYGSFDDISGIAGIEPRNGGYFALVHIEEPIEANDDGAVPTEKEWYSALSLLVDSIGRSPEVYNSYDPHFKADPTKFLITTNNWDDTHPVSILAEKHLPVREFMSMNLGGMNPDLLLGNKTLILENWDHIVNEGLLKHFAVEVTFEHKIDGIAYKHTLVRETKLANPLTLNNETKRMQILAAIQSSLIENDKHALAVLMGMADDDESSDAKTYNIHNMNDILVNTDDYIGEGRNIVGRSIGWDVDVNRRLVATPLLITAELSRDDNPLDKDLYMRNVRFVIAPQIEVTAYGRGLNGEKIPSYLDSIANVTKNLISKYPITYSVWGSHLTIDNDQGSFSSGVNHRLNDILDKKDLKLLNSEIQIKNGIHDILKRQKIGQTIWDEHVCMIDQSNISLIKFIQNVKKNTTNKKRIEKGKYEKLADFINSYESAMTPFVNLGLDTVLVMEKYNEEELIDDEK